MNNKCAHCNNDSIEYKKITMHTCWGKYKYDIKGIDAHVCSNCNEIFLDSKTAKVIQKISKALSAIDDKEQIKALDVSDIFAFLKDNYDSIYDSIINGDIQLYEIDDGIWSLKNRKEDGRITSVRM